MGHKKIGVKKNWGPERFIRKYFGSKKNLGYEKFWVRNILVSKKCLSVNSVSILAQTPSPQHTHIILDCSISQKIIIIVIRQLFQIAIWTNPRHVTLYSLPNTRSHRIILIRYLFFVAYYYLDLFSSGRFLGHHYQLCNFCFFSQRFL